MKFTRFVIKIGDRYLYEGERQDRFGDYRPIICTTTEISDADMFHEYDTALVNIRRWTKICSRWLNSNGVMFEMSDARVVKLEISEVEV